MTENHVYVFRFGDFDHKIGISNCPPRRLHQVGGQRACRTWRRDDDARNVEVTAHRMLREWQIAYVSSVERFQVTEATACLAVELAISLLADDAAYQFQRQARQPATHEGPPIAEPTPRALAAREAFGPPAPVVIGLGRVEDRDALIAAGAPASRIYLVRDWRDQPTIQAAQKACRAGDILLTTRVPDRMREAVTAKGAALRELDAV